MARRLPLILLLTGLGITVGGREILRPIAHAIGRKISGPQNGNAQPCQQQNQRKAPGHGHSNKGLRMFIGLRTFHTNPSSIRGMSSKVRDSDARARACSFSWALGNNTFQPEAAKHCSLLISI